MFFISAMGEIVRITLQYKISAFQIKTDPIMYLNYNQQDLWELNEN